MWLTALAPLVVVAPSFVSAQAGNSSAPVSQFRQSPLHIMIFDWSAHVLLST